MGVENNDKSRQTRLGLAQTCGGILLMSLTRILEHLHFEDQQYVSGFLTGMAIVIMLIGVYTLGKTFRK